MRSYCFFVIEELKVLSLLSSDAIFPSVHFRIFLDVIFQLLIRVLEVMLQFFQGELFVKWGTSSWLFIEEFIHSIFLFLISFYFFTVWRLCSLYQLHLLHSEFIFAFIPIFFRETEVYFWLLSNLLFLFLTLRWDELSLFVFTFTFRSAFLLFPLQPFWFC